MSTLSGEGFRPLRPVRIRCYHFNPPFKLAFHSPQTKRLQADSVIVRLDCSDGTSGFGESAPRHYVTGENSETVVRLIVERLAPVLFRHPVDSIPSLQALLARLRAACRQDGVRACNSAIGAIDLALLDASERARGTSPEQGFPAACRRGLRACVSIPFLPLEVIRTYFPVFKDHVDMSVLKVLVSEDTDETYERVKLIRRLAGADSEVRLEFNGRMAFAQVRQTLERLRPFEIRTVEEPLPPGHLEDLHRLRTRFGIDLIADESLVTLEDAERLARNGAHTIFNIKVSKCGGLLQSMQIAQHAGRNGICCHVGTHVGESQILGRAGRRLARHLPNFDCYGGGSDLLFSRLLESQSPRSASQRPPDHQDMLPREACLALISECRLLADTGAAAPVPPRGGVQRSAPS